MRIWPVEHNDGDNVPQEPQAPHRGDQHLLQEDLRPLHIRGAPGLTMLLTGIHLLAETLLFPVFSDEMRLRLSKKMPITFILEMIKILLTAIKDIIHIGPQ